ncbi:glycosyltransferase [uncultured Roseobacter sp.]|uniref:glycosyltransferase n=1 Tax=uncultured Roseobacter sp. TaxID=114847 RepID=UPI00261F0653|nr:glycosyltransferase [uncultured Roseobacter sp.]
MTRILYLAHDLDDAAIWRRTDMLRMGGADVIIAGFRRSTGTLPERALVLGQTHNGKMLHRAAQVLRLRLKPPSELASIGPIDVILCRNLEMLALGAPLHRALRQHQHVALVYEVLDIHRLMIGQGWLARGLRWLERRLSRDLDRLIVSSPAFQRAYFDVHKQTTAPALLIENKVMSSESCIKPVTRTDRLADHAGPLRIGWFGILRCPFSLACLDAVTRARPGRYQVISRGRPALDSLPNFHDVIAANPDLIFDGPYSYPDDLARIYGEVDLAWLVDQYDMGSNSDWLLPNRLYESGLNCVPPIALDGTEIATRLRSLGIGVLLPTADVSEVTAALDRLDQASFTRLRERQKAVAPETWAVSRSEARHLVDEITPASAVRIDPTNCGGVLIVIPTLNESAHIGGVIDGLKGFLKRYRAPVRVVVVDGGSTDDTVAIVTDRISTLPHVDLHLLDNPARLQSAGVNRACATFGNDMTWLLRLDAHAAYPETYADVLLAEAQRTEAESVVVAMHAIGRTPLQQAISLTQNGRLGNGGSAHRTGGSGRFVDHGHHALMRLEAFRAVGGYDDGFSHNEDAEFDLRLTRAGYRIWLTSRTRLDYVPRKTIQALARQYLNFGRGRARTVLKHRLKPRLRQMIIIAVAPLVALAVLGVIAPVFAIPAAAWAIACIAGSLMMAVVRRDLLALAAAPIAMVMHLSWSVGFWQQLLKTRRGIAPARPESIAPVRPIPSYTAVAVGVCTFQRPSLVDTLQTLEQQKLPPDLQLSIIVVDNDRTPTAQETVKAFAARSRHNVIYKHAPSGNISIARNAALDEAKRRGLTIFAFIDDDERAPANWLATLSERLSQGDADVVVGPVHAVYPTEAPRWMQRLRIHDTRPELGPDGRPLAGHSCNVIMNLAAPALMDRRFDLTLGISGGEDTAFFKDAQAAGARLALAPQARLDEPVAPSRATFAWLLRRRFRMGQTHGSLLRKHKGFAAQLMALPLACAKVFYCAVFALATAPFAAPRNANLLRGALHFGTIASLIGLREVAIYGHGAGNKDQTS